MRSDIIKEVEKKGCARQSNGPGVVKLDMRIAEYDIILLKKAKISYVFFSEYHWYSFFFLYY